MLFKETGDSKLPTIILLHGGGLSYWSLSPVAALLTPFCHVVTPVIDGHGEIGDVDFISIEDSARKLLAYIDERHNGKVLAVGGLSLGAQIAAEALSQRADAAQYAILESALVIPMKAAAVLVPPVYNMSFGLIKQRWFSKLQAKSLFIPEDSFEQYYADSNRISKKSLNNIAISNLNYTLKDSIGKTASKVLILYGEKELGSIKKSAVLLKSKIRASELYAAPKMRHGEFSLARPAEYVKTVRAFIS